MPLLTPLRSLWAPEGGGRSQESQPWDCRAGMFDPSHHHLLGEEPGWKLNLISSFLCNEPPVKTQKEGVWKLSGR